MKTLLAICFVGTVFLSVAQGQNNGTLGTGASFLNGSVAFNGQGGKITAASRITVGTTGSLSVWFTTNTPSLDQMLFSDLSDENDPDAPWTYIRKENAQSISIETTDHGSYHGFGLPSEISSFDDHSWYNLIITRDNGITRVFINGKECSGSGVSQAGELRIQRVGVYWLEAIGTYTHYSWNGSVKDFRVYTTALTQPQINSLAGGSMTTPASVLYWKMNEISGQVIDWITESNTTPPQPPSGNLWTLSTNNNIYYDAGAVGIGTGASQMGGSEYKLFVRKGIRTEKLKVDIPNTTWPDFVFDKNYKLLSLEETEKFVKLNNHLPGIPSAKDVEKNGIDVGANQALLLQKIEELTLLIIQQNKRIAALENKSKK